MRRKSRWTSPTLTLSISTDEATVWLTKPSPICRTAHGRFSLIAVLQCRILHCLESYALNCFRFEPRWLESLSKLKLPIQLLWGDSDAVSPMSIPRTLAKLINPDYLTFTIFPDTGKQIGCPKQQNTEFNIFRTLPYTRKTRALDRWNCKVCIKAPLKIYEMKHTNYY